MDWESIGVVKASHHREKIVKILGSEGPKTPGDLKNRLSVHFSQASFLIKVLVDNGIIVCLNPTRKRGRLYGLTKTGNRVYAFLLNNA